MLNLKFYLIFLIITFNFFDNILYCQLLTVVAQQNTTQFKLSDIKKISFDNDNLSIDIYSGKSNNYDFSDINFMHFIEMKNSNTISCSVFPNPVFDKIYFNLSSYEFGIYSISIYTIEGKIHYYTSLVIDSKFKSYNIDISHFQNGIYFFSIFRNSKINTYKIIKL